MPEQKKVVIYSSGSVVSETDYSSRAYISTDPGDDGDRIEVRSGGVAAETVITEGGTMTVLSGGTIEGINVNDSGTFRGVGAYCSGVSKWYGPAICGTCADEITIEGGSFLDNAAVTSNYSGQGGAIETYLTGALNVSGAYFAGNYATGGGGAILDICTPATITDTYFLNNSATYGGAVEVSGDAGATAVISGGTMRGNSAGYGGAVEVHSGASLRMENVLAVGNTASDGGAVMNDCYDDQESTLELVSGAYVGNTAFRGGAVLNSSGKLSVSGGTYSDNVARMGGAIYLVPAASAVSISGTILTGNTAAYDAEAGYNASGMGGAVYIEDGAVVITDAFLAGNTAEVNPQNAWEGGCGGGIADCGTLTVSGGTMNGNVAEYGGALYVAAVYGNPASSATVNDAVFTGNSAHYGGGAISNTFGDLTVSGGTFMDNVAETSDGGAIANWYTATVSGASFGNNRAASGGALSNSWGQTLTVSGCRFTGNTAEIGGAIWQDANSVRTTVSNCVFSGNTAATAGGAIWNGSRLRLENVTLDTLSDTIHNTGTITLAGTDVLNASITGSGSVTVSDADIVFGNAAAITVANRLAFTGTNTITFTGAVVNFTAQDLTGASITVDGSLYAGIPVTVATGVSSVGSYTITGGVSGLALYVENSVLYMGEAVIVPDVPQESFTGSTMNVMAGGTIAGAFVGIRNAAAGTDVKTVVSGGTLGDALIGGALVGQGETGNLGTVTLDISGVADIVGGTANGGMIYAAGYAYGADPDVPDASATLTVTKSVLNLSAGSVAAQNLYAGAHARKGAYTVVNATEVNVTGGSFGRVYGGGWSEKHAKSEVGSAAISISGGVVDYVYAGGANGPENDNGLSTVTGDVTITVSGDASVDFVFLAGKNRNCTIGGDVTLTVSGENKTMTRVSGYNACGDDRTVGTTALELRTGLSLGYLDHVDKIRIAEGCTLDVSRDLWYEATEAMRIDFDLDGELDTDWTAMSGEGMDLYRAAQYTFNGGPTVYTYDETTGKLGDSGYGLDFSESRKVKLIAVANS